MVDGASLRAYRAWVEGKTPEQIKNADPDDVPPLKFKWQAMIEGILSNSADYNNERAERGFNEAFDQSPYLSK